MLPFYVIFRFLIISLESKQGGMNKSQYLGNGQSCYKSINSLSRKHDEKYNKLVFISLARTLSNLTYLNAENKYTA